MAVTGFKSLLGIQVQTGTVVIPQTVASPGTTYFTIAGGIVLVTGMLGVITTAIGGAVSPQWQMNPTTGTASVLCTTGLAITAFVAGDILTLDGALGDAMLPTAHAGCAPMFSAAGEGIMLPSGNLSVITAASQTGNWYWILWYLPVTPGATVVNAL